MPEPTPEAWAQIRHAYEQTDKPLAHICAEHEVTVPTARYRMKVWEWKRRKPLIPRQGPPAVVMTDHESEPLHHPTPPASADASAVDPPPPGEGKEKQTCAIARILYRPRAGRRVGGAPP